MEQNNQNEKVAKAEDEHNLLVSSLLPKNLQKPPSQCFIYKVPVKFCSKHNKDTYEPCLVSIGPYHYGKESLKAAEELKKRYVSDFISRKKISDTSLINIFEAMRKLELDARDCYAEPIHLASIEFVKMMVLDGCFIIELFQKYLESFPKNEEEKNSKRGVGKNMEDWYKSEDEERGIRFTNNTDPILSTTWMIYSLRKDLVLLENQLPFIVLEKLFDLTTNQKTGGSSLIELVIKFFNPILPMVEPVQVNTQIKGKHILDLLRNHLLPTSQQMEYGNYPFWEYTHSATHLWDSGVKFRKKEPTSLLDITFNKGVLEIPPFFFGESWTVLLPNLIALEQCRSDYRDQITSYVILMNNFLTSQNDVNVLRNEGIMFGLFRDNENVAEDINNLVRGVVVDKFYYDGLCCRVNSYYQTDWHKCKATLKRKYLRTPWVPASFLAAGLLLVLTMIQTILSILSYSRYSYS